MADSEIMQISQQAIDMGMEELYKPIEEELRPDEMKVRKAAEKLIEKALTYKQDKENLERSIGKLNTESQNAMFKFTKDYIITSEQYEEMLELTINFQRVANEFLGQKIFMVFTYISPKTGEVELYNVDGDLKDILNIGYNSFHESYEGRMTSLAKIKEAQGTTKLKNENKGLQNTFKEVWQRYRISKDTYKIKGGKAYILWRLGGSKWDGVLINNAGPLGEAYIAFFVNNFVFSDSIELSVKTFMIHKSYGAINSDKTNGFLQGDITKGGLEIGVKMLNAEPLGYSDIITYAQQMLEASNIEKYLKNLKKKLSNEGQTQKLATRLSGEIKKEYSELVANLKSEGRMGGSYSDKDHINGIKIYEP